MTGITFDHVLLLPQYFRILRQFNIVPHDEYFSMYHVLLARTRKMKDEELEAL